MKTTRTLIAAIINIALDEPLFGSSKL